MGSDEYVKQIDEECIDSIPLDSNTVNIQKSGYFNSNIGAPYGMVYTQVPLNQQQSQQPLQHFNDASKNFSAYLLKDGQYIPVTNDNNINSEVHPMMPQIIINPITTYEDESHTVPALCLFLFGFFLVIPWIANVVFIKSKNKIARALAISSVTLFSLLMFLVVSFIILTLILDS